MSKKFSLNTSPNKAALATMGLTAVLMASCLQQQSSQVTEPSSESFVLQDDLGSATLLDIGDQESVEFSDDASYQVFQRVHFDLEPQRGNFVQVEYVTRDTEKVVQQLSPTNERRYHFLIPPFALDEDSYVNVNISGQSVGHIFVRALSTLDEVDRDPGEISLIAANSLLYGLRNDLEKYTSRELAADENISSKSSLRALFVSQAIDEFQQLILALDNAIVFGESLTDSSNSVSAEELETLDRFYAQLLLNVSSSGVFLDGDSSTIPFNNNWDVSTIGGTAFFNTFYSVAKNRYSTLDGVRALSTLLIGSDDLSAPILNLMVGSVFPAIAVQIIRDESPETAEFLREAYLLLEPRLDNEFDGSIAPQYERSRLALKLLADQIATLEATAQ